MSSPGGNASTNARDPDLVGAEAAMHRAAEQARRRAEEVARKAGPPPTVIPAVTPEEGRAIIGALQMLRAAGLTASASHLHKSSACINSRDWAGSIRESIHAVESVARRLVPGAQTLGKALKPLKRDPASHPAFYEALGTLYGYTNDESGIRHALLEEAEANVGMDEAVYMLGACASFSSYLWRKHNSASG